LKDFAAKTAVPIAAGERCISIQEFEMMLNAGMRIARPDVCTLSGFTGSRKVCVEKTKKGSRPRAAAVLFCN
jgi:L-alanine-DL-glutamate epimerase-like enolase superfamily enzyme